MPPKPKFGDGKRICSIHFWNIFLLALLKCIKWCHCCLRYQYVSLFLNFVWFWQAKRFYVSTARCCMKPKHWKVASPRIKQSNTLFTMLDGTKSKRSFGCFDAKHSELRCAVWAIHFAYLFLRDRSHSLIIAIFRFNKVPFLWQIRDARIQWLESQSHRMRVLSTTNLFLRFVFYRTTFLQDVFACNFSYCRHWTQLFFKWTFKIRIKCYAWNQNSRQNNICFDMLHGFYSWDEWVQENRVLKFNDSNVQRQKELAKQYSAKNKKGLFANP